ncbi:MAG: MBL fold metallo-hydrolase [Candidatus Berkelbacteria bacterium]|nr:MBL fold metallo-hydrolase [Candidatus Berkelbacteria bacterium]
MDHRNSIAVARALKPNRPAGIKLTALGGQSEKKRFIGPNCWLETLPDGQQLMFDCGGIIDESDEESTRVPDFRAVNLKKRKLAGIGLSHGHLDHVKGLPALAKLISDDPDSLNYQIPVYGTATTLLVAERQMSAELKRFFDFRLLDNVQQIGDFTVRAYPTIHSIPECVCFVTSACGKDVAYIPDCKWLRSNWSEKARTKKTLTEIATIKDTGLDVALLDSTYATEDGYTPSVVTMEAAFADLLTAEKYRDREFVVLNFASETEFAADLTMIANQVANRPVYCLGSSMRFFFDAFGIIDHQRQSGCTGKPVGVVTGSQYESGSAIDRAINGDNRYLTIGPDKVFVLAAKIIPNNKTRIATMVRKIRSFGAEVITSETNPELHVSGHEKGDGLKEMGDVLVPRVLIPQHSPDFSRQAFCDRFVGSGIQTVMVGDGQSIKF